MEAGSLKLSGKVITRYKNPITGEYVPGSEQVDTNMVVDLGAVNIVKWLANSTPVLAGAFKFMGVGTVATAAAHGQTALLGELTAGTPAYARISGTQTCVNEVLYPANGAKVYQVLAEFPATSATGSSAIAEYALFDSAIGGTSVMLIRAVFSPTRDLANNNIEVTYQLTVAPQ